MAQKQLLEYAKKKIEALKKYKVEEILEYYKTENDLNT